MATESALAQHHPVVQPRAENVNVPGEGDSIPMLDFGGRPVAEVMINGKGPYRFIVDTGAALTVLDSSVAVQLAMPDTETVHELRIGKVAIRELPVVVNSFSEMVGPGDVPRGVLSASSFPGALVTFDYPGKRIIFSKGILPEANTRNIFGYDAGDLPSVPVKAANREI
ncbi:MAG TPA: retropepsin-like aspartic protease, partial [Chthoniobacterales bacterium]